MHSAGRCPNSNSLFPPLAAVVAVAGHSIARPIAALRQQGPTPADGPQRNSRTGLGQAPAAPDTAIRIRKLLGRYDLHTVQRLAALGAAMEPERAADFAAQAELAAQLDADGVCCRVSQLAVNGRDLMAAGIPAGPGLRRTLEALLDAVVRGQLLNERQCLLDAAGQISAS